MLVALLSMPAAMVAPRPLANGPIQRPACSKRAASNQIVAQVPVLPAIATAATAATAAAFAIGRKKWNAKLDPLQNLIFISMGSAEQPVYQYEANDAEYEEALTASRMNMDKGMGGLPTTEVAATEDVELPSSSGLSIPTRLYYPPSGNADSATDGEPLPLIFYCHGGGFVQGSIESHDAFCRRLCAETGFAIASVGYRLAPEARWPAQVDDAFDALNVLAGPAAAQRTSRPLDKSRVVVAGDSAGGTIAAELAMRARDSGLPLKLQLLLCPALDAACNTASFDENSAGPMLTANGMRWFWRQYLPTEAGSAGPAAESKAGEMASPLRFDASKLSGVAPAHIVTAELDVLREEGEAYAEKLRSVGVQAEAVRYDGVVHAFLVYAGTPFAKGDAALADVVAVLKERVLA